MGIKYGHKGPNVRYYHPLPAAITSTMELRSTYRLRLREACHLLYVSNLGMSYG
ncbi:hypothetical protein PIB30_079922, partial [Stylosanthes scabra]|nr:hypothetical protein [Stylosanthes scabra]